MADEKRFPRITGYTIIVLFLLLVGSALALIADHFIAQTKTIVIYFPKIGELRIEEPLMLNGMPIGTILKYEENVYDGVSVTVAMHRNIRIRKGYEIYCADVGLFGTKREIVLINGPKSAPEVKSTNSLHGSYFIGITEVISSVWRFQNLMTDLSNQFEKHFSGDGSALKIISKAQEIINNSEQIGEKMSSIHTLISVDLPADIDSISSLISKTNTTQNEFRTKIPGIKNDLLNEISTLDSVLTTVHKLIGQVDSAAEKVESIESKDSMKEVVVQLKSLATTFDMIRTDAHKLLLLIRKYEN